MFFAALFCVYGDYKLLKTEKPKNKQKTSLQSYKTRIKILPFPGLALSGTEQPKKVIIGINFNPELALTGFQTTLPSFQQVNLTRARDPVHNQHLGSGQLQKYATSSCRLEPAIWSRDTGQQIPCFDRCQLMITWMSSI